MPTIEQLADNINTTNIQTENIFNFQRKVSFNTNPQIQTFDKNLISIDDAQLLLKQVGIDKCSQQVARIYSEIMSCWVEQIIEEYKNFDMQHPMNQNITPAQKLQYIIDKMMWKYPQFDKKKY